MLALEGRNIARWESIYTPSFAQIQMSKCYFKKKCQYSRGVEFKYITTSPYLSLLITLNNVFIVRFFFYYESLF